MDYSDSEHVHWRAVVNWVLGTVSIGRLLWTGYWERCLLAGCCELGTGNCVYWQAVVNWVLGTVSIGGLLWTGYWERCLLAGCCELGNTTSDIKLGISWPYNLRFRIVRHAVRNNYKKHNQLYFLNMVFTVHCVHFKMHILYITRHITFSYALRRTSGCKHLPKRW